MADISVIGLGKLGTPMVAWFASKVYSVVGTDQMRVVVELLARGETAVQEPGLDQLLQDGRGRIGATESTVDAVMQSGITFIVVPTPSGSGGAFILDYVEEAAREIGRALGQKTGYHLVVITSTVMPGHSRKIMGVLEEESGKACGPDFGLCYNPEFIALGTVIDDLEHPDFVLIGESDKAAGATLEDFYNSIYGTSYRTSEQQGIPIRRMSFESAEIAKLGLNVMLVNRIMFASVLADTCQHTPYADVDDVTGAIGCDRRIGPKLLKAGPPPGGPCLPRDTVALLSMAQEAGYYNASISPGLLLGLQNETFNWYWAALHAIDPTGLSSEQYTVGVAGIAYKPDSHITEGSAGWRLAIHLVEAWKGQRVWTYDPIATGAPNQIDLGLFLNYCNIVCLMLPLPEFKTIKWQHTSVKRVIDFWRYLDPEPLEEAGIEYIPYGRNYQYYE